MKPEKQLSTPTKVCKICFKEIKNGAYHDFLNNGVICYNCLREMNPEFIDFEIDGVSGLAIYEYADFVKTKIFEFKGCGDYELKNVFLGPFSPELRLIYRNYELVPVPSYKDKEDNKGDHVVDMFSCLGLKMHEIFIKTEKHKQSDQNYFERQKIGNYIKLKDELPDFTNKSILLVDDICTTGSSLKACLKLLKQLNPKRVKILVVAKRLLQPEEIAFLQHSNVVERKFL